MEIRFGRTIVEEANRLRRHKIAVSRSSQTPLDERSTMWVMRMEAWQELISLSEIFALGICDVQRKTLFNWPVRLTVDDHPDTPMIQLVMEPLIHMRKRPTAPFR